MVQCAIILEGRAILPRIVLVYSRNKHALDLELVKPLAKRVQEYRAASAV